MQKTASKYNYCTKGMNMDFAESLHSNLSAEEGKQMNL
jgi:hypothetical protein